MPVVDTVKVGFEVDYLGSGAVRQIEGDLTRVQAAATRVEAAFRSVNPGSTDFLSFSVGDTIAKLGLMNNEIKTIQGNMERVRSLMASGQLAPQFGSQLLGAGAERLNELNTALGTTRTQMTETAATAATAGQRIGDFVSKYRTIVFSATAIGASLAGTAAAFKSIYDFSEQGSNVRQLGKSFQFFNENVSGTPNLLNDMREAARGTISDMSLMSSFLTLVAGTSRELATRFAETAPQLLEVAKAANVLNPTLGDTQFFFESLARGIKRGEIRLLDNLGIIVKVGDANKAFAQSIGKTVDELSAEERQIALLNETLRVGQNLIEQVGGEVSSLVDPYQQAAAATENWRNALQSLASLAFTPSSDFASMVNVSTSGLQERIADLEAYKAAIVDIFTVTQNDNGSLESVRDRLVEIASIEPPSFGGKGIQGNALRALALESITTATTVEQAISQIGEAFGAGVTDVRAGQAQFVVEINGVRQSIFVPLDQIVEIIEQKADETENAWRDYYASLNPSNYEIPDPVAGIPYKEWKERLDEWNALQEQDARQLQGTQNKGRIALSADRALQEERNALAQGYQASADLMWEALAEYREAQAAWRAEINNIQAAPVIDFATGDGTGDLIVGNIRDLGTAWVSTTNATDEQRTALSRWREEASRLEEKLGDLQLGIGTFGKEEEKVSEQIADTAGELEYYRTKIAALEGQITSTTSQVQRGIDIDDQNVYKGIIEAMEGLGAGSGVVANVAQEFGLLSPAAADAAIKIGFVQSAIELFGQAIADGSLSPGTAKAAIDQLIGDIESGLSLEEIEADVNVRINARPVGAINSVRQLADFENIGDIEPIIRPGVNTSTADTALAQLFGLIENKDNRINVTADTLDADNAVDDFIRRTEAKSATIVIKTVQEGGGGGGGGGGSTNPDDDLPPGAADLESGPIYNFDTVPAPGSTNLGSQGTAGNGNIYVNVTVNNYGTGEPPSSTSGVKPPRTNLMEVIAGALEQGGVKL